MHIINRLGRHQVQYFAFIVISYEFSLEVIRTASYYYFKTPVLSGNDASKIQSAATTSLLTGSSIDFYKALLGEQQYNVNICFIEAMALTTPGVVVGFEMPKMSSVYVFVRFFLRELLTITISPYCNQSQLCIGFVHTGSAGVAAGTLTLVESLFAAQQEISLSSITMAFGQKALNKALYILYGHSKLGHHVAMTLGVSFVIESVDEYFKELSNKFTEWLCSSQAPKEEQQPTIDLEACYDEAYPAMDFIGLSETLKEEQQPTIDLEACYDDYKFFRNDEACSAAELDIV